MYLMKDKPPSNFPWEQQQVLLLPQLPHTMLWSGTCISTALFDGHDKLHSVTEFFNFLP